MSEILRCTECGRPTPVERLTKDKKLPSGHRGTCRECESLKKSCRLYGITPDDYRFLFFRQHGRCAICKDKAQEYGIGKRMCIDHDHRCCTGCRDCVRGLLCAQCNFMIGCAEHSPVTRALFAFYVDQRPLRERGLNDVG